MKTTEKIFDVQTGETTVIERKMTEEEIAQYESEQAALAAAAEAAIARDAARQILLDRLGITADEAKLLLS